MVGDGWPCWAFSNHDIVRHVTRWKGAITLGHDRLAALAAAILLSLRGSVCLYQGEELGLTEADLAFEDLRDPYGIRFWPEFKGRDGCRTPMVWESNAPNAGFSDHKPWLPIAPEHVALAVNREAGDGASTLAVYKRLLAFRRAHPALKKGTIGFVDAPADVLAFIREGEGEKVLCVFNISGNAASFALAPGMKVAALDGHGFGGRLAGGKVALAAGDVFYGSLA